MNTWTTRAETDADIPAIRDIILRAFPTAAEADLVDALRADPAAWIDGLSMIAATADGRPVGHALLTRCHVGDEPALQLRYPRVVRRPRRGVDGPAPRRLPRRPGRCHPLSRGVRGVTARSRGDRGTVRATSSSSS